MARSDGSAAGHHPDGWKGEARATLALALPIAGVQLAQIAINTTDVMLIGGLGAQALAAAGLGINMVMIPMIFGLGLLMAVAALTAQALGQRRHAFREARRILRQGLFVATFLGVIMSLALWPAERILILLGQSPENAALAQELVQPLLPGLLPTLWFVVLRAWLSAFERTRAVVIASVIGVAVNAVLNYGLIFGHFGLPKLGLFGAGIGSSIVNTLSFVILLGWMLRERRFRRMHLFGRFWRLNLPLMTELLRVGLPIGITMLLEVALFAGASMVMGWISTESIAAHQIAIQCAAIAFMVPLGIGQAATVRVGLAAGAGDIAAARLAGFVALVLGIGFSFVNAGIFITLPDVLIALFINVKDPANAATVTLAGALLTMAALFQLVDATQAVGSGALRGLKDTRVPAAIAAVGYWGIGAPIGIGLAIYTSLASLGMWVGFALGLLFTAIFMVWRFMRQTGAQA